MPLHDCKEAISDSFSIDHVAQNTNEAVMYVESLTEESTLRDRDTIDEEIDELRDV